jgi:hypothetical protein
MYKINGSTTFLTITQAAPPTSGNPPAPGEPYEGKPLASNVPSPVPGGSSPHQGCLIQTQKGDWYFMPCTCAYPSGRLPVLASIQFQPDCFPLLITTNTTAATNASGSSYPLPLPPPKTIHFNWSTTHYPFPNLITLPPTFEWNHNPDISKFSFNPNSKRG